MKVNNIITVEITNKEKDLICDVVELCDFDYDEDIATFMRDIYNSEKTTKLPNAKETISIKYTEEETPTIESWKVRDLLSDLNEAMTCTKCPLDVNEKCNGECINLFLDYVRKYNFKFEQD